ncbi:MAG: glycine cleavage system protein GcvH [Elusimicrobia bacterium]|nr:glycine cleavage system protein GcvH [Elusimicrobiota bacterium]
MTDTSRLKFAKSHEWVRLEGKEATVGISDFAQQEIRDIVYLELPKAGKELAQGAVAGTIESVKAAFEIYAPVAGRVMATNEQALKDVALVHKDPYGQGWLFKLEVSDPAQLDSLMNESAYAKMTSEGHH